MHFSLLSTLAILPLTLAQYDTGSSPSDSTTKTPPSSTTTVSGKIHKVTVGQNNTLAFDPPSLTAAVGDYIEWHFFPATHSVIQASFSAPCAPVANAFVSGGFVTAPGGENTNVFRVLVNSTAPLWYYCGFPGHCQGGMVGVVNPPANATIEQFAEAAAGAPSVAGPRTVNGGIVGAAAVEGSSTPSPTTSAPPTTSTGAGVEAAGSVQWVAVGFAALVGVLGSWIV